MFKKLKAFLKTKNAITSEKLAESYLFASLGLVAGYFTNKLFDLVSGVKDVHVNWATVGFTFLYGFGAPVLRLLDARFPILVPLSKKLVAILSGKAYAPTTATTTSTSSTSSTSPKS